MSVIPRVTWFDEETRARIVAEAVRILDEVGVFVENDESIALLDGAGARVEGGRIHIPADAVERALASAPSRVTVHDQSGEIAMDLGGDRVHFNPGSAAIRIHDLETDRARVPVTEDLVRMARLTDALPGFAAQSTSMVPGDVPEWIADRYRLYLALLHSRKPVVTGTFEVGAFGAMRSMLEAVAGGPEGLRKSPPAIFDCCPSPPLKWSDLTAQALVDCARAGIPAELVSMPMTGATGPVTLAGAVTQHCAETLSGIVIHQLAAPGAPIVYGGSPACFDMRKGTTPMGAVETMMIDGAYAEIGKHLGLPTHAYMALSDSKTVDYQAGLESAMGAAIAVLSGVNNVSGPGMLDFESCQSLPKLLLDHEVVLMAKRLAAGIEIREDPLAQPVIAEALEKEEFLSLEHTRRWYREEVHYPGEVIDRATLEEWESLGGRDAAARAGERVERILDEHEPEPPDADVAARLREIMQAEAAAAGLDRLPDLPEELKVEKRKRVRSFFARHASGYSVSESHRAGKDLRMLLDRLVRSPTDRGLDIGTGVGHTALALGPSVREVVGLDLTPEMGAEFHANRREAGAANLRFVAGDVEELPFPDGSFDVVTCRRAAHHFPDPARAVREMARVLKPGGAAGVVDMSTPDDPAAAALVNEIESVRDSSHGRALPPAEWERTLAAAGLVVEALEVIVDRVPWLTWIHPVSAEGEELGSAIGVLDAAEPAIRDRVAEGGLDGGVFLKRRIVAVARKP